MLDCVEPRLNIAPPNMVLAGESGGGEAPRTLTLGDGLGIALGELRPRTREELWLRLKDSFRLYPAVDLNIRCVNMWTVIDKKAQT